MVYVLLAVLLLVAAVVGVDTVRQRRRRLQRPNVSLTLAASLETAAPAVGGGPLVGSLGPQTADGRAPDDELGGIWTDVSETVDLEGFRPKLAEGAEIKVFRLRWGSDYGMIASPDGTQHFPVEPWEADLARKMDGTRTVGELIVERLDDEGDLDPAPVLDLVETLRMGGVLDPAPIDVEALVRDAMDPASRGRKKLRTFTKELTIHWDGAEAFAKNAYRRGLRLVFTAPGAFALASVGALGLAAFLATVLGGRFELVLRQAPVETAILLVLAFALTFFHELGHALVLVHFDRRVLSAGFFIFFGSPAFFVDASDVLMLDRRQRITQSFAGPFAELFLAGAASIVLFLAPDAAFAPLLYRFAFVNYLVILENLIPLLQLDGYWILCDLIETPDLRPRSLAFIQSDLWHKLRARERFTRPEIGLALYGVVGAAFTVFSFWLGIYFWEQLFGGLIGSLWRGGLGSRILLVLLIFAFAGPILRGGLSLGRAAFRRIRALVRRVRFRLEQSWRVEAARLIDGLPVFEDLPADLLSELAGRVRLRTYPPERAVIRQGDQPTAFYVIRSGTVAIEDADPKTGDVRTLRTLSRGESFGELGLLESAPRRATARATTNLEVFEVDKGTFDRLLADSIHAPSFGPTMQSFQRLQELPAFARLSIESLSLVLEHGEWRSYAPGEVVIEEGEPGDAFYSIGSGHVEVRHDGQALATLGRGDHFGELALLNDAPRNATITATTPLSAFRLDRDGFDTVVAESFRSGGEASRGRTMEH